MPIAAPAQISVIVVNYGTAELAIAAVDSVLERRHGGRAVDMHLVDNASPGGDAARLAAAHAERGWGARVTLYPETVNHGFGRGNNLVLRALAARPVPPVHVMLLNPDARLDNEAIDILAGFLDGHPAAVAAGAGIALPDGTPATAAFRFPSAAWDFAAAVNLGPVTRLFSRFSVPLPPGQPRGRVDWVAGAAVMFRRESLAALGGFDPAFFLYFEEVELMHRLKAAGGEIWYLPEARVVHVEGASTAVRSGDARRRRPGYWYESWLHYHRKTQGRAGALAAALCWLAGAALNGAVAPLRGQAPAAPRGFFGDFTGRVLLPLLGVRRRGAQEPRHHG